MLHPARREDNRGRPWHDTRAVSHGVFWILGSGAQRSEMPAKYPPYPTCHRGFQQWICEGRLVEVLRLLARQLHERGKLNLEEALVDATFASAKRVFAVGPTKRGKGTEIVAIASGYSLPLSVSVESVAPAECRLVEAVLAGCFLDELPARLISDKAYDSDALDTQMNEYGVERISPNRSKRKTQEAVPCAAIAADGKLSGSLHGCRTIADSSPGGKCTSTTSSASYTSLACSSSADIYEIGSR